MQVTETLNDGLKRGYQITITADELDAKVNEKLTEEQARLRRIQYARKEFLPDGTLHLVTGVGGPRRIEYFGLRPAPAQERVFDVNDQLLWEGPTKERPYAYLSWAVDALVKLTSSGTTPLVGAALKLATGAVSSTSMDRVSELTSPSWSATVSVTV